MTEPGKSAYYCKPGALARLRQQQGVSIAALAAAARVSQGTIYRILKGKPARLETLELLANALNTHVAALTEEGQVLPSTVTPTTRFCLYISVSGVLQTPEQSRTLISAAPSTANHLARAGVGVESFETLIATNPKPGNSHRAIVCLWIVTKEGEPGWVILAIRPEALGPFMIAESEGKIDVYNLTPFGEVVCSARGLVPPDDVIARVAAAYRADAYQLRLRTLTRPDAFAAQAVDELRKLGDSSRPSATSTPNGDQD